MTHYRKKIKFSFDNLDAARNGYANLKCRIKNLKSENTAESDKSKKEFSEFQKKFIVEINDDLNVTGAMAVLWDMLKDEKLNSAEKLYLAYDFDKIFALDLEKVEAEKLSTDLPPEIIELAEKRKEAKKNKDFKSADELRNRLKEKGYEIVDTKSGYELSELK
jgi:cysteinyl-tRNA synthetase